MVSNVPVHDLKTYRGRRGISPLIPNGGTRQTSPVGCVLLSLYPNGKNQRKQLKRGMSGDPGEEKNLVFQPAFEPRFVSCPSRSSVTIPTELWRTRTLCSRKSSYIYSVHISLLITTSGAKNAPRYKECPVALFPENKGDGAWSWPQTPIN